MCSLSRTSGTLLAASGAGSLVRWVSGASTVQWTPPEGYTARPGRYINTGRRKDSSARRNLSGVCRLCYPVVLVLHRFSIAISRNCDDSSGLAPHPLVWSAGGLPKRRRIADVVRDVALLPGPLHLWDSGWVGS